MASYASIARRADREVAEATDTARKVVLPRYGKSLREFPVPVPPSVLALYIAHESGGVRWTQTKYPEVGLAQLTAKRGDNEVRLFDVDPLDPRSHVWAAQQAFWRMRSLISSAINTYLKCTFEDLLIVERVKFLWLARSVGASCTRSLIRVSSRRFGMLPRAPIANISLWLSRPDADTSAFDGAQGTDQVRLRFLVALKAVTQADASDPFEVASAWTVAPPRPRQVSIVTKPRDFESRIGYYCRVAKGEGPKPTGPWEAP